MPSSIHCLNKAICSAGEAPSQGIVPFSKRAHRSFLLALERLHKTIGRARNPACCRRSGCRETVVESRLKRLLPFQNLCFRDDGVQFPVWRESHKPIAYHELPEETLGLAEPGLGRAKKLQGSCWRS